MARDNTAPAKLKACCPSRSSITYIVDPFFIGVFRYYAFSEWNQLSLANFSNLHIPAIGTLISCNEAVWKSR